MVKLCRQVRQAERYNWAATRGVNEEMLMENLPDDLQREIRRHLFKFVNNVSLNYEYHNRTSKRETCLMISQFLFCS